MLAKYKSFEKFVIASSVAGVDTTSLAASQVRHLCSAIGKETKIDMADASALMGALGQPSNAFGAEHRTQIAGVLKGLIEGKGDVTKKGLQTCLHFYNYLTQAEWDGILAVNVMEHALDLLTNVMIRIGCPNPSEPTKATDIYRDIENVCMLCTCIQEL